MGLNREAFLYCLYDSGVSKNQASTSGFWSIILLERKMADIDIDIDIDIHIDEEVRVLLAGR